MKFKIKDLVMHPDGSIGKIIRITKDEKLQIKWIYDTRFCVGEITTEHQKRIKPLPLKNLELLKLLI